MEPSTEIRGERGVDLWAKEPWVDLEQVLGQKRLEYRNAEPFPHCAIDGLLDEELLERVLEEFPRSDQGWRATVSEGRSKGKQISEEYAALGPHTRYLFAMLGSPPFLRFVERLTGIPHLIADPHMKGGGLHEISSGGFLELHTDFNWNAGVRLYRRVNLLLYLNRDWKEEYNGHLELWDSKLTGSAKYAPLWNRLILSVVEADALHGFPVPIACPPAMTRRSLAMWYYSAEQPARVQLGYDLCPPRFIERRDGRARPLSRPFWRKLVPPVFTALDRRPKVVRPAAREAFVHVLTRLTPPILVEAILGRGGRRRSRLRQAAD